MCKSKSSHYFNKYLYWNSVYRNTITYQLSRLSKQMFVNHVPWTCWCQYAAQVQLLTFSISINFRTELLWFVGRLMGNNYWLSSILLRRKVRDAILEWPIHDFSTLSKVLFVLMWSTSRRLNACLAIRSALLETTVF